MDFCLWSKRFGERHSTGSRGEVLQTLDITIWRVLTTFSRLYSLTQRWCEGSLGGPSLSVPVSGEPGRWALCPGAMQSLVLLSVSPLTPSNPQMMNQCSLQAQNLPVQKSSDTAWLQLVFTLPCTQGHLHQLVSWELWLVHSTGSLGRRVSK